MTAQESSKILTILKGAYPRFYKDMTRDEVAVTIRLWTRMFEGDEYHLVAAAVETYIASDEDGFPPSIGAIKAKIRLLTHPDMPTEQEAWSLVRKAISYYDAREKFTALPKLIQEVIGGHSQLKDWARVPLEDLPVIQSNFMRSYRAKVQNWKERESVPISVLALLKDAHIGELPEGEK